MVCRGSGLVSLRPFLPCFPVSRQGLRNCFQLEVRQLLRALFFVACMDRAFFLKESGSDIFFLHTVLGILSHAVVLIPGAAQRDLPSLSNTHL